MIGISHHHDLYLKMCRDAPPTTLLHVKIVFQVNQDCFWKEHVKAAPSELGQILNNFWIVCGTMTKYTLKCVETNPLQLSKIKNKNILRGNIFKEQNEGSIHPCIITTEPNLSKRVTIEMIYKYIYSWTQNKISVSLNLIFTF